MLDQFRTLGTHRICLFLAALTVAALAFVIANALSGIAFFDRLSLIKGVSNPLFVLVLFFCIFVPTGYMLLKQGRRLSDIQMKLSTTLDERQRTDMALREAESRLDDVLEGYDLGILIHRDLRPLFANAALARILGYDSTDQVLKASSVLDFVAPNERTKVRNFFSVRLRGGEVPARYETRAVMNDGEEIWVELGVRSITWSGEPVIFVTASDITERKNAEAALRLSESRLSRAQAIAHFGNWELRYTDNTLWWSDEVYRLFGMEPDGFVPNYEKFLSAVHPDDRAMIEDALADSIENGTPYNVDHRIVLPDGTHRYVHEQGEILFGEDGASLTMLGTVHDVTERKLAEQKLQKSEARQRRFAADVAHELRTPLSVMRANLDNLGDGVSLYEDVDSMARLVEQLLAETRAEMVSVQPDDLADLHAVCVAVVAHLAPIAIQRGRDIEVTGGGESVWVRGQSGPLEQAVRNLVDNAIKYADRGSTITVDVTGEPARLSVVSRGRSIPADMRESIFSRYTRSDQREGGMGLGLSIVKRIVSAHGGHISLSDVLEGEGAIFTIEFPDVGID